MREVEDALVRGRERAIEDEEKNGERQVRLRSYGFGRAALVHRRPRRRARGFGRAPMRQSREEKRQRAQRERRVLEDGSVLVADDHRRDGG